MNPTQINSYASQSSALPPNVLLGVFSRSRTPNTLPDHSNGSQLGNLPDAEPAAEDDPRTSLFSALYAQTETKLDALFGEKGDESIIDVAVDGEEQAQHNGWSGEGNNEPPKEMPKKTARTIDEDDYGDSDDEEEPAGNESPLKSKSTGPTTIPRLSSPTKFAGIPPSPALTGVQGPISRWQGKTTEDVRKRLEEDKKAAEDEAKSHFQSLFYPVTNDRDAMLEQQKLEESDRQVDVELSGHSNAVVNNITQGSLSQANLGASSLVLKHLIARIDAKREKVKASDQELRNLMIEVKKNRSKWASEDKVGQEELYEAAEKVLSEVKAITEHSQPFLQRVNKRDAPEYYNS